MVIMGRGSERALQVDKSNDGKNRDRDKVIWCLHPAGMPLRKAVGKAGKCSPVIAIALAISSCGVPEPDGQVLAVVDGEAITQSELRQAYELSGADGESRTVANSAVEEMVDFKLLAKAAKDRGAEKTAEFHFAKRRAQEQLLIEALRRILNDEAPEPASEQIANFIAANPQSFSRRKAIALEDRASGNLQWVDTANLTLRAEVFDGLAVGQDVEVAQRVWRIAEIRPIAVSQADQRKLAKQQLTEVSVNQELARILQEYRAESVVKYKNGWGPSAR